MIKEVKLAALVEDTIGMDRPDLLAKHGVSFFVEAKTSDGEVSIMMDTGPSPNILSHNVDKMGVDLRKIGVIMLSHAHYDHTGGLIEALKRIKKS